MGVRYKNAKCRNCGKNTKFIVNSPNHILHLLLTLITFGFWIIIWVFMGSESFCDVCGKKESWW